MMKFSNEKALKHEKKEENYWSKFWTFRKIRIALMNLKEKNKKQETT